VAVTASSVRALLFTDIEGSTGLIRRFEGRYEGLLERHYGIIRAAVSKWSGEEQSRQGDSLFITFPSVAEALQGALDAQLGIEREPWPPDGRVRVRMGLHVGEVAVSSVGLVGLAIHQAARIMSAGRGGQIVVSADVVQQAAPLPEDVTVTSLGSYELRDVGHMLLYQLGHVDLQTEFPELRIKRAVAHNLPTSLTSLVGRVVETETVLALMHEHRLVSLLGEGGCGKTRLALNVAAAGLDRFVDGVWFVDLSPLSPGADVAFRLGQVLGVPGGLEEVVSALRKRELLVVLDNCEHVVDSVAALVARLLSDCPTITVVATSRVPLSVAGEARFTVPPLGMPSRGAGLGEAQSADAVRLFTERARLVRPGFQLSERDVWAVVELCVRVDGLPLAVELAAARLRGMSLEELVGRIDDRFGLLVGGPRSAPERHRTLRNAVNWSFRLLDADEQQVLRHLSVFRGGCDVATGEAVCGAEFSSPGDFVDVVIRLIDMSLVSSVEREGATRYFVHETIREYALGMASDAERASSQERHARWFAELASRLSGGPAPGGDRTWIRRHNDDRDNLRTAAEWFVVYDPPVALRLLIDSEPGMSQTFEVGWLTDMIRGVLPLAANARPRDRAAALGMLARQELERDRVAAFDLLAQACEVLGDLADPVAQCHVLTAALRCHGDATGGHVDPNEVAVAVAAGDRAGGTYWPIMIRHLLSMRTPPSIVESLSNEALRLAEGLGLDYFAFLLRGNLAMVAQFRGDSHTALAAWRELTPMFDDVTIFDSDNTPYYVLAEAEHGDLTVGLHLAEHFALRLSQRPHDPDLEFNLYTVLAHCRRLAGDVDGCETVLEICGRAAEPTLDFLGVLALITRSAVCRARGHLRTAATVIERAIDHVGFRGLTDISMRIVEELAAVAFALGRTDDAAMLLATATAARERDQKPLSPACRPEVDALYAMLGARGGHALSAPEVRLVAHSLVGAPS
jgi:predicted ATPase/class 3 adenylate cyclase